MFGENFEIKKIYGEWVYGRLETDNYSGYLKISDLGNIISTSHKVSVPKTIVLSEPNIKSNFLGSLSFGSKLNVIKYEHDYVEITYKNINNTSSSNIGYIPKIHIDEIDFFDNKWVKLAESFVGTPYKWGGRSSFGIDCSGLLQISILKTGFIIPRDTKDQINSDLFFDINFEDSQRGDIIFWDGHVAIFIKNNFIIHANAFTMSVAIEKITKVLSREETKHIRGIKRLKK